MIRRILATLIGAIALTLVLAAPAMAQTDPDPVSPPAVLDEQIVVAPEVKAESVGLAATGSELGGAAVVGLGLTGVGIALAVGARRRRTALGAA